MLFSTWEFILAFLPAVLLVYFLLNRLRWVQAGKLWLVGASLFFYGYWNPSDLFLVLASITANFGFGTWLAQSHHAGVSPRLRTAVLGVGIALNLAALGFFKYADFVLANVNALTGSSHAALHLLLPLAISFFTFTQIAYLVDSHRGETAAYGFVNYCLFVTFFPHLIAGPIVHHKDLMGQFASRWTLAPRYPNLLRGLYIFGLGLFKKLVIADQFGAWADPGFGSDQALDFFSAWAASLSYTFQLYFDFSGYCDMAIGASLLFNIRLPINFNSPYKAVDIQDFWRRWHITLSNFLRDYLYIPLGGNRRGELRTCANLFVTFLIGGLWHGASWMFVAWGALHGAALIVHRLWQKLGRPLPAAAAWALTFLFVNVAWVFFRARSMDSATRILAGMVDIRSGFRATSDVLPASLLAPFGWLADELLAALPASLVGSLLAFLGCAVAFVLIAQPNSQQLAWGTQRTRNAILGAVLFAIALQWALARPSPVFLYYNF
jgi:D-alanyl-lipoteichoic acid acyltransferase DltB (MBOAT superfamily)